MNTHRKLPPPTSPQRRLGIVGGALSLVLAASSLHAQDPMNRPVPLPAFGRGVVGNGDSTALVQNPANLAFLPGPELRWTGAYLDEGVDATSQGHAFGFALPLGFAPLATGIRLDLVNPTSTSAESTLGRNYTYQWLTWGLAMGSETASMGLAYQRSYSDAAEVHGMGSWNLGINLRPSDYLGLGGVIYNVNRPKSDTGASLGPTYEMAVAVRPMGTDVLQVSLENSYVDDDGGYWVPRAALEVGIPELGRIRGDVSWLDATSSNSEWVASTSLVLAANSQMGSAEASVGTRFGDGMSGSANRPYANIHTEVAFRGFLETTAAEGDKYARTVRLEKTPGTRGHVRLLRRLWEMAENEEPLAAVVLEIRDAPARSLARVQELKDAIYHLQNHGKKVICHMESATGSTEYLCSAADWILINPAGGIRYSGLASSSFYLKGLLDKVGLRADFVRIGKHKSAPEGLTRNEGTATAVADRADLIQEIELEISSGISRERKMSIAELRASIEKGPFTAVEAKQAQLVDDYAFDDMIEKKTEEIAGTPLTFLEKKPAPRRRSRFGPAKRLAIVYVDGDMVDGRSQTIPLLGMHMVGSYTVAEALEAARKDASIGAVVLRIETGGGSAMAADVIWREVQLTTKEKPVIVSMGSAAASGGYYIAAPGTYIYANPLSITGSIGIFYGKVDAAELLGKIGVNVETLRTSSRADAPDLYRPFTDEERKVLERKIQQFYGLFLRRVAEGRDMTKEEVDQVGRGRVWTGRQALEHNLVDGLGGLRQALAKARVMGGLRDDAPIVELPVEKRSLIGRLLGVPGLKSHLEAQRPPLPAQMLDAVRALAPYALFPSDQPLARIEHLPELLP